MGVSTRSGASKTRSGRLTKSFEGLCLKSPPTKKKSQVAKSKIKAKRSRSPVAPSRQHDVDSTRRLAEAKAIRILSRIKTVKQIGGAFNTDLLDFFDYRPTLTRYLAYHLRRRENNPELKTWIYLVHEAVDVGSDMYKDIFERFSNPALPIIVSVECKFPPLNYTQHETRGFSQFEDLGWEIDETAGILVSSTEMNADDYTVLPLKKPSMVASLQPNRVEPEHEHLSFRYNGIDCLARTIAISEDIEDLIETEASLDPETDLKPLKAAAKAAKRRLIEGYRQAVQAEKDSFSAMVASLASDNQLHESSVTKSLEDMKVFKIYPEYEPETLPPPREISWFGGMQIKGEVKNRKLDASFGNVDGFY